MRNVIIVLIVMAVIALGIAIGVILEFIKNKVTLHWMTMILNAICRYQKDVIHNAFNKSSEVKIQFEVEFSDMRDYDDVYARWYDWGYKNILPKDKLEIIKPYMGKEQK